MEFLDVLTINEDVWTTEQISGTTNSNGTIGLVHFAEHFPYYAIDLYNLTDWSWSAQAPVNFTTNHTGFSMGYERSENSVQLATEEIEIAFPYTSVSKFGFGLTTDKDQYYKYFEVTNLPNDNTLFALNFPGIGLTEENYDQFSIMLRLASHDTFRCETEGIGSCSARIPCPEALESLWDLSFQIHFEGLLNYLRLPLASLAVNHEIKETCTL